ncbi:hypothetical protein SDC9_61519 [bioreactor metagenome]|uniref:DUF2229 domain-containing protein n=1 Tax=bioreactor metagenome TaxID=1076179 RepID=A0A644XLQ4_9ZZZZ
MDFIMDNGEEVLIAAPLATVGLPSSLMFYEHGGLWEDFFTALGCRVISSGPTTREILDLGVSLCSNEACLPVKVFTGHAAKLAKETDFLFIPRYASMEKHEMTCPKFCGLPDMVRLSLQTEVKLLEITVDYGKSPQKTDESLRAVSRQLGIDEQTVREAFSRTVRGRLGADTGAGLIAPGIENRRSVAVLGHPYMIYDELMSMGLIAKLTRNRYQVLTPDSLTRAERREHENLFRGRNFYEVGSDILGSAFAFLELPQVEGLVYLSPFACGIDSLVTEFIERRMQREKRHIPFLKVTIDEHTGEAGFDTRLEAFLDMLEDPLRARM